MIKIQKHIEMDENVKLSAQMEENVAPVILINKFNVKADEVSSFTISPIVVNMQKPMLRMLLLRLPVQRNHA